MDRFETDAVADSEGVVHVHVGTPGARVHVAVVSAEVTGMFSEVLDRVYGSCSDSDLERPPQGQFETRDTL